MRITRNKMPTLIDTVTGETYRMHICYEYDPDQYPDGKPIDPSDKLTELNDKGEWVCGECKIEEFNKHKMLHWDHNTPMLKHLFKRKITTVNVGIIMSRELIRQRAQV
jgi:hypothetical protein